MNLSIQHISKKFGDQLALDDISLQFDNGVYGILGANGSGKTTLMKILATILKPSNGHVLYNGQDIFQLDHRYREVIGYLPQQMGLYKNFTAEKFLLYISSLKGLTQGNAKTKVKELLDLVGLSEHKKSKVGTFSGGMKKRVGIAQALLNDPEILIVDEPTAGLDPKERIRFRNMISTIASKRIVLLSTHIVSDIEYVAKEIVMMKKGRIIQKNNPELLLRKIAKQVWLATIPPDELPMYEEKYQVGNIVQRGSKIELRIISDVKPSETAIQELPNLEDLYLFYFDKESV